MSSFTRFNTSLKLEYIHGSNKDLWRLLEGFSFYSDKIIPGKRIIVDVPAKLITDGASVPRLLWSWIPPLGDYGQAAVLHDYARTIGVYSLHGEGLEDPLSPRVLTTKQADDLFLEAMEVLKVSRFKRTVMYLAVRAYAILTGK